jgi:hypothetical protein
MNEKLSLEWFAKYGNMSKQIEETLDKTRVNNKNSIKKLALSNLNN